MALNSLKGIGPKSRAMLAKAGIETVDQLMAADPFDLYCRLKQVVPETSLNMLYAIIGAQEGIDWRVIAKTRKTEIIMRLDDMGVAPK